VAKRKDFKPSDIATPGFGQDWGGVSLQTFGVQDDVQTDLMQINEALKLQEYYKSPEYLLGQTKTVSETLQKQIGATPFADTMELLPDAKPLIEKDYGEEQQPFVKIYNDIIENGGITKVKPSKLWGSSFLAGAVNNSMTNGWYKLFTGSNMADDLGSLKMKEDGFYYDGHKLNLNDFENKLVNDYVTRKTGADSTDFLDKIGQTFGSLMVDMPLIMLSSYAASGVLGSMGSMGKALTQADSFFGRLYGQSIQQAINFNVMGLPQTVEAYKDRGVIGATESIYHSAMMGVLASATGTIGTKFPGGIFKKMMQSSPAMMEEIGGVAGSFGFGYLSGALAGEDWEDNLATGLAFAATHFANPKAYRKVLAEVKRKDMPIYVDTFSAKENPYSFHPTYFIKEGGKYYPIDTKEFKVKGDVVKLSTKPIESPDVVNNLKRFNETVDHYSITYAKALADNKVIKYGKELYNRFINDIPDKKYTQENKDGLRFLSNVVASQIILGDVSKKFAVT